MPFDVEQELINWKNKKIKSSSLNKESIEELGDHLFEAWAYRCEKGESESSAWSEALKELNCSDELEKELRQVQELAPIDKWALKFSYGLLGLCIILTFFKVFKYFGMGNNGLEGVCRVLFSTFAYYFSMALGVLCFYIVGRQLGSSQGQRFDEAFCQILKKGMLTLTVSLSCGYFLYALIIYNHGGFQAFLNARLHIYWLLFCIAFSIYVNRREVPLSVFCSGAAVCAILSIFCWHLRLSQANMQVLYKLAAFLFFLPLVSPYLKFKKQLS